MAKSINRREQIFWNGKPGQRRETSVVFTIKKTFASKLLELPRDVNETLKVFSTKITLISIYVTTVDSNKDAKLHF